MINKKILYLWIAVLVLEIFLFTSIKGACVDPGGCGTWMFLGKKMFYLGEMNVRVIILLVPIVAGIVLTLIIRKIK